MNMGMENRTMASTNARPLPLLLQRPRPRPTSTPGRGPEFDPAM